MRLYINLKLAGRFNLMITLTVAVVISVFAWFIIRHEEAKVKELFTRHARNFTLNLAYNCEFGLLTGSIEDLTKLLNGALQENEVIYTAVLDADKKLTAYATKGIIDGDQNFQENIFNLAKNTSGFDLKIMDHDFENIPHFDLIATIYSNAEDTEEDILYIESNSDAKDKEAIGQLFVCFTLAPLYKGLFFDRCIMIITFSMVVLIVSVMIMLVSRKLVINPLASVLEGIKAVGNGNLDYRLQINRKDEFGEVADGFNEMTKSMKLYTENLRLEKEFSEELIQSQMDLVVVVDKSGILTRVNRATLALLNYSEKDVLGRPASFIFGSDTAFFQEGLLRTLQGKSVHNLEIVITASNNIKIPVSYNGAPLKDGKGRVTGSIGVGRDLREQKKDRKLLENYSKNLERMVENRTKELRQKDTMLVQAGKLASLGEMATGIAHEINQPLNVIKITTTGMLYFLKKGKKLPQGMLEEELGNTDSQVERIRKIINHLKTFSRRSKDIETEEVDINIPLRDSLTFVSEQFRLHEIEVKLDLPESIPNVMADANKLEQVFLNILTNARDAMDSMERSVENGGKGYRKAIKIRSFEENGNIVVAISDTGGGIPEDIGLKIFEPFFTTKEVGKGTGLGMSISYNLMKDFKGSLSFDVEDGVGTTFRVTLPALPPITEPCVL